MAAIVAASVFMPGLAGAQGWVPPIEMAEPGEAGQRVAEAGITANFLPAAGKGRHPAILLLGGSEGGLGAGALIMAKALQSEGFSVLQLSYYRAPGQPEAFAQVPLETFDRGIAWLKRAPGVDRRRIAVVGGSKGAEGALIVASRHPEIRAVVAGMPSSYMWAAFSWDGSDIPGASWSLSGKDVPFLPYGPFDPAIGMASIYLNGLKQAAEHPDAAIPVARIRGKVLLICGKKDALWPSCPMADMLKEMDSRVTVLAYEDAGHAVFGVPLAQPSPGLAALGGSPEGNNDARKDGWPRVVAFLRATLGK